MVMRIWEMMLHLEKKNNIVKLVLFCCSDVKYIFLNDLDTF